MAGPVNTTIVFLAAKGGSGCTTVAARFAAQLYYAGYDVHLSTAGSRPDLDDAAAVFGLPDVDDYVIGTIRTGFTMGLRPSHPSLDVAPYLGDLANVVQVIDGGTRMVATPETLAIAPSVLVLRTDFLSLRRARAAGLEGVVGLVVLTDPLGERDVAATLGRPVLEVFPYLVRDQVTHPFSTLRTLITVPPPHPPKEAR